VSSRGRRARGRSSAQRAAGRSATATAAACGASAAASGRRPRSRRFSTKELRKARLEPLHRPDVTLRELVDVFQDQYEGAPSSKDRLDQYLGKVTGYFGAERVSSLDALATARWRRACRRRCVTVRIGHCVKCSGQRCAGPGSSTTPRPTSRTRRTLVRSSRPSSPGRRSTPWRASSFGPLAIFSVGTGVRTEEASGADWTDVDLTAGVFTVRRAFAKSRLKPCPKTVRSRPRAAAREGARCAGPALRR